jgi:hypothetical protein
MNPTDAARSHRVRTLPIRVAPLPGEAMDSWLEAIAARSTAAWGDLLHAVGLAGRTAASAAGSPVTSNPSQFSTVAAATGVSEAELAAMTVDALLPGSHLLASKRTVEFQRLLLLGSRFCPKCLATNGGRWLLWWRLQWAFACPIHGCLLAHACPRCGRAQRERSLPTELSPTPGHCMVPASDVGGRLSRRCGTDLSAAATLGLPDDHPAIRAQQIILTVVAAGSAVAGIYGDSPVPAAQYMRDLAAVGMRALRYGSPGDLRSATSDTGDVSDLLEYVEDPSAVTPLRSANVSAPSIAQAALAACVATPVLSCDSATSAGQRLHWLVATSRERGLAVRATNIGWARDVSPTLIGVQLAALAPFLNPIHHLRYRCFTRHPRRPTRSTPTTHRSLPALLWHRWVQPVGDAPRIGFEQLRSALSVAVVTASRRSLLGEACALLGEATTDRSMSRVLRTLGARPDWAAVTVMASALADLLSEHPAPIDYERRRHLPMGDLLPEQSWRHIGRTLGINAGGESRLRVVRCWLHERVTGSPARQCEHALDTSEFRAKVADLPRILFPELVSALDDAARRYLDDHGLAHEPLRWSPPDDVAADWLAWQPASGPIDVARVHDLIGSQDMTLGAAAAHLGVPIDVVREVLNEDPAPRRALTSAQRRSAGVLSADLRVQMSRERLVDLYVRQGLSLKVIGEIVGASRHTITRLAGEYDVALRPSNNVRRTDLH